MILKGRKRILTQYSSEDMKDIEKLALVLNHSRTIHNENAVEIKYLIDYRNGLQPILNKEKLIRDEINNKLVINHAEMITRNIIGYFLGTPIQYIQNGDTSKKEDIDKLNRYVAYEDKSATDKEVGEFQSICGTAFRIIYTDGIYGDEVPFEDSSLNPLCTYVVYENSIAEKPIVGVTYHDLLNNKGQKVGERIYAYTEFGVYTIDAKTSGKVDKSATYTFAPYDVGGVPIIEYPNNMWRIGDWELCIGLMDAINALHSGRLDDIDQVVQSLLVFMNAEIDSDTYDVMREKGVVMLKNNTNNPTKVETISSELDQTGMNLFAQEMESLLYAMIGIPDRNNRKGGGGDTGQAVELRDGWADLEIIARNKELAFKRSEKQTLRIILRILSNKGMGNLSLLDVDIKFSRNKNNNLLVKTQSYQTLLATKTLSPADCLTIVDLVSDVNEYISRGQAFWGASFAGLEQAIVSVEQSKVSLETAKNPPVDTGKPPVNPKKE